jgi:hypothetical protein
MTKYQSDVLAVVLSAATSSRICCEISKSRDDDICVSFKGSENLRRA